MVGASDIEVLVLASERLQNLPRAVGRDMVDGVDPVAEAGDVPDRLLDENILVPNEHDADDLQRSARAGLALLAGPVENWANDPSPVSREETPSGITVGWVVDVECHHLVCARLRIELRRRDGHEIDVDQVASFVQQVAGNPCRRRVLARRRRLMPARVYVHRVEAHSTVLVEELNLRDDRTSFSEHPKADLDSDR